MKKIGMLLARYEATCRKMHERMMGKDFSGGIRLLERMYAMSGEIMAFGAEGRESLFRMAEGDDVLIALNAAHALYERDPKRCARALKAIIRKDDGFFAYAARMMLSSRKKGPGALLSQLRGECSPRPAGPWRASGDREGVRRGEDSRAS